MKFFPKRANKSINLLIKSTKKFIHQFLVLITIDIK